MTETVDSAGVRFPPPFVYVAAVALGYLLNQVLPLPVGRSAVWKVTVVILAAAWGALTFSSFVLFWRRRNSIIPTRPANELVVSGPYRFSRNPMYVGLAVLTTAVAIVLNTWWPVLLLVPALIVIRVTVIAREERYLRRRFGAEYDAYTRRVRRWI